MRPVEPTSLDDIDLSNVFFWSLPIPEREGAFQKLRREDPIRKFKEVDFIPGLEAGDGYYAITRHADILEISRQPAAFCSGRGATSINDMPTEMLEFYGSMINMDDPRHGRLRGLVSKSFTPRVMQHLMDDVQRVAVEVIERIRPMGACDFVTEVSQRLPLKIICDMMGIPESQYDFVLAQSNIILSSGDPEYIPEGSDLIQAFMTAGADLAGMMSDVAAHKRTHPGEDLTSALVTAELDGERLSDQELASFFILLLAAGNETTRNAISHGLMALADHPEQRAASGPRISSAWRPPPSRRSCAGRRRSSSCAAPRPATPRSAATSSMPATSASSSTTRRTGTSSCSTSPIASTCAAIRTSTSASAVPGRTSVSAPTSPAARSR